MDYVQLEDITLAILELPVLVLVLALAILELPVLVLVLAL
jgi:hypothetical protein